MNSFFLLADFSSERAFLLWDHNWGLSHVKGNTGNLQIVSFELPDWFERLPR
jgi:hypothetical protein